MSDEVSHRKVYLEAHMQLHLNAFINTLYANNGCNI